MHPHSRELSTEGAELLGNEGPLGPAIGRVILVKNFYYIKMVGFPGEGFIITPHLGMGKKI